MLTRLSSTHEGPCAWLSQVGPSLTTFTLESSAVVRVTDSKEYTLDATIATMVNLGRLQLGSDFVSELMVLCKNRRFKDDCLRGSEVILKNTSGISMRGLVDALRSDRNASII